MDCAWIVVIARGEHGLRRIGMVCGYISHGDCEVNELRLNCDDFAWIAPSDYPIGGMVNF